MTTDVTPMEILTDVECWRLVAAAEVGRLAISINNHPDVFPINFVIDGGAVVFRTAPGTKLAGAVLGPAVAFEVDGYDPAEGVAWSVVAKGPATEIEKSRDLFAAEQLPLFPWHDGPKHHYVRITPYELTGRRFRVGSAAPGERSGNASASSIT